MATQGNNRSNGKDGPPPAAEAPRRSQGSFPGTNGDEWEGTSGERTSGEINEATTYTLTCTAFNGDTVTDEATVNIVPVFQET